MKKSIILLLFISVIFSACKKLEDYEGNNVPYSETPFELVEKVTLIVPNSEFSWIPGLFNCMDISAFGGVNFEAFITTQNPNPYAHLVHDMRNTEIKMELTNVPDCDFGMLENATIYLTDFSVTSASQFILQDPNNISAPHNAVKIGELLTIPDGSSTIFLDVNPDAVIDQFIHAGSFNTYANLNFDKAFTEDQAIIKTTLTVGVKLINDN